MARVKSMLPSMMTEAGSGLRKNRRMLKLTASSPRTLRTINAGPGRVAPGAQSEERWEQEFKAQRDLMQAGFAVDWTKLLR